MSTSAQKIGAEQVWKRIIKFNRFSFKKNIREWLLYGPIMLFRGPYEFSETPTVTDVQIKVQNDAIGDFVNVPLNWMKF